MNKNQKHVPTTYTDLMKGNRVAASYHQVKISAFRKDLKPEQQAELKYHKAQLANFDDDYARFSLAQAFCDDATVVIR